VYRILFSAGVEEDLKNVRPFHRNRILDQIEESLTHQPTAPGRNRKLLVNLLPPWEATSLVWELRSGDYRVFYDVDADSLTVNIRAIRKKPRGKTTEDIL
jgi:mRNA-degrading endonuclease RelE of RelBE toxin-antitoxin system